MYVIQLLHLDFMTSDSLYHKIDKGEEKAKEVASRYAQSKLSRFIDFENEARRNRLLRHLLKTPPKLAKQDHDGESPQNTEKPKSAKRNSEPRMLVERKQPVERGLEKLKKVSLRSNIVRIKNQEEETEALRKEEIRKLFQKKVRIIVFCIRCVKSHSYK